MLIRHGGGLSGRMKEERETCRGRTTRGEFCTRQYTLSRMETSFFELYEGGVMSGYLRTLREGDVCHWRGPFLASLHYSPNMFRSILAVAGGTGLAPFVRLFDALLADDDEETRVRLLLSLHSPAEFLLQEKLREWTRHWNFSLHVFFAEKKEREQTVPFGSQETVGKLDEDHFERALEGLEMPAVLVCGPPSLEKNIVNYAIRQGVPTDRRFRFT